MRPPRDPSRRPTPAKHSEGSIATRRLFVATLPAPDTLDALLALIATLRTHIHDPGMRWQTRDQLHLTWRFLGDTAATTEQRFCAALADVARSAAPVETYSAGWQYWPSSQAPRVLVVRLEPMARQPAQAAIDSLATGIEHAAQDCGFAPESKPFRAHVTLARVGKLRSRVEPFREPPPRITFPLDHLALIESTLARDGARYAERLRWRFGV